VRDFLPQQFQPGIICAQSELKNQATCHGDSGGPFMIFNPTRQLFIQIGILSGGLPVNQCGIKNNPSVLTVLNHPRTLQFIRSAVRKSGNSSVNMNVLKLTVYMNKVMV